VQLRYCDGEFLDPVLIMNNLFEPRGMNKPRRPDQKSGAQLRTDGWVGGRADTWHGHPHESPASRAGADARRMSVDKDYAAEVAVTLRASDEACSRSDESLVAAGLQIEPVSPGIGVVVRGIDMAKPTGAQVEQVRRLFLARKVVFFHDQGHISREEHMAFARCFADIGLAFGRQQALSVGNTSDDYPEILRLHADEAHPFAASNWHSDVTWSTRPPLGSILLSRKSPPVGGDTMFVDAFALWDNLSPVLKEFLEGRNAIHGRAGRAEAEHPICRTHPETGRKALYINPTFTNSICGLEPAESSRLLAQLYAKMYSTPEVACRFQWRDGSVAMWDNRSCQHYAVADFWPHERLMERVTLLDKCENNEIPFWTDASGERHHGVALVTEAELATPIGGAAPTMG
jgi:taurine dioxygenase